MGRVVILGGTGAMGSLLARRIAGAGHEVCAASRSSGVDAQAGTGLDSALAGADVVVDCLNHQTLSRRRAQEFFGSAASHVAQGAAKAGVRHVVALSIVNVTRPEVTRSSGYYAGKAAQEQAYSRADVPVSLVATTAWFTLAETFLGQFRVGGLAFVPRIGLAPVHPDAVCDLLAAVVAARPPDGAAVEVGAARHEVAGPHVIDAATMARAVAAQRHPGLRVVALPAPTTGLRRGLLPGPDVPRDGRRFEDWLSTAGR
jgi:uncharacterized protein YbjT (DUF2867 family)